MYRSVHKKKPIKIGEGEKLVLGGKWVCVNTYLVFRGESSVYTPISGGKMRMGEKWVCNTGPPPQINIARSLTKILLKMTLNIITLTLYWCNTPSAVHDNLFIDVTLLVLCMINLRLHNIHNLDNICIICLFLLSKTL
jgi:hypothetical protein